MSGSGSDGQHIVTLQATVHAMIATYKDLETRRVSAFAQAGGVLDAPAVRGAEQQVSQHLQLMEQWLGGLGTHFLI